MASTNFVVKNGLTVASGTVVAGGSSGSNGQVLASTGTGVQWVNAATGTGDVVGPASSTDNAVTRFDSTTGKLIQNSTVTLDDNGNFDNVNSVVLDNTPATLPTSAGTIYWEDGEGTPEVILKGGNTLLKVGTQEYARVYNDSGSTVTKGQVVYISGAQGNRIAVKLARADVEATSFGTLGLVAETITNGAEGWIIVSGALYKLNTNGLTAGATVYLSPTTAGEYTTTKPQAPNQLVVLGFIERVSTTVGSIYVKVDNGYELDELHDVQITSPISGNTLIYDATTSPTGVWKNASLTAGTGISVTNGAGSITIGNTGVTSVSGTSPVVSSGGTTPAISLASGYGDTQNPYGSKTANYFLAAPNGSAGVPTFRAIVAADIPTLNQNTTGTAANVTGIVAVANGGTGLTSLTAGYIPYGNGTSAFGSSANLFWDSANSRLGVGTASPSGKLTVISSGTSLASFTGSEYSQIRHSDGTRTLFTQVYDNVGVLGTESNTPLAFTTNNTERMRLDATGLGIGTASPADKLHVEGNIYLGTTGRYIYQTGSANLNLQVNTGHIVFLGSNGSTEYARLTSTGLGIGTSSPRAKLETSGSIFATSRSIPTGGAGPEIWWSGTVSGISSYDRTNSAYKPLLLEAEYTYFLTANGSEQMRINNAGVGIGTSNPAAPLHISRDNETEFIINRATTTTGACFGRFTNEGGNTYIGRDSSAGNRGFSSGGAAYATVIVSESNHPICFGTNNIERMRISSNGFVGIGTTASSSAFTLYGNETGNQGTTFLHLNSGNNNTSYPFLASVNGTTISSSTYGWLFSNSSSNGNLEIYRKYNSTTADLVLAADRSNGNVGIGTTSPSAKLSVNSGANRQIYIGQNTSNSNYNAISLNGSLSDSGLMGLAGGGTGDETLYVMSQGNMVFRTVGTTERMRIDSSGNVAIGNTSPSEKLHVTGNIRASGVFVGNGSSGSYTKGFGGIYVHTSAPTSGSAGDHHYVY